MGCCQAKPLRNDSRRSSSKSQLIFRRSTFVQSKQTSILQDYELHEVLGSGAFAQVRRATEKLTGETRAVKILHKRGVEQDQIDEKFKLRELKILTELDHPNILHIYRFYEDRTRYYVVMEYCQGGELFARLTKRRHFTEAEAASVMFQLLSAVAYCHDKHVIHRDLKPENILLEDSSEQLNIRVADFGSSAFFDVHKKLNGRFGTPYYIAPEVLEACYNEKCDMWSCGIIMYILLTGRAPYRCESDKEVLKHVAEGKLALNTSILSDSAKDLLGKMLTKSIRTRISAAEALTHPWLQKRTLKQIDSPSLTHSLKQLSDFHNSTKLKDAIHTFIATQIISRDDTNRLTETFKAMDANGDGKLSREELLCVYREALGETQAEAEVKWVMDNVDTDFSGFVDFTEFLRANLDKAKHLSAQNLEAAFKNFDMDGNGTITLEELKSGFSREGDENLLKELIQEADLDGDGQIDWKEFTAVVLNRA